MSSFKFLLGEKVVIAVSNGKESGVVIGRAEYMHAENSYLIRYQAADGRAVEQWWTGSALESTK